MAKILLIDDRGIFLDQARSLLAADAHDLIEARDGLAGLHRAVEDLPDLIVVALTLAGLDGLEICRRLVACDALAGRPIVVWGELSGGPGREQALAAGAVAYVDRTRAPASLRGAVRHALRDRAWNGPAPWPTAKPGRPARVRVRPAPRRALPR